MNIKPPIPLNLPKDKTHQFDEVAFVNDMTQYSLKVFIKRIWEQLMTLANVFDTRRSDVPLILDRIMSGQRWTKNDVYDRFEYGIHPKFIIQYDTLNKEFILLDNNTCDPISSPIKSITILEIKKSKKKI